MRADFTTHSFAPHWHEAFVVGATESGGAAIKSRGSVEQADPDALFAFNPGEPHAGWMGRSNRWRYRSLYITKAGIDALLDATGMDSLPDFKRNRIDDSELARAFLDLHRMIERGDDPQARWERLIGTFALLCRRHACRRTPPPSRPDKARDRVKEILAWLRQRHSEPLKLELIAREFGMTQFQLIAAFNQNVGLPPHACVIQFRLNAACSLLRRSTPPAEAAIAAGFYDQSALNRHFKRCYGITPMQYAAAFTVG